MAMGNDELNSIDTSAMPLIAVATSASATALRWTTLRMWFRGGRRPILVEVFGGTKVDGELQRIRRRFYATPEEALAFLEPGRLADKMRCHARTWCQINAAELTPAPVSGETM